MSRDASIDLLFGGETRRFKGGIKTWEKVQAKTDCGPQEILDRLTTGTWKIHDLRETIRQGLIQGGMAVADVDRLLMTEFDDLPVLQFLPLGQAIAMTALVGAPDEDVPEQGEPEAGEETASPAES